ncbi:GntR family transcriptional regulator [Candidatus Bipolaricaulota bacterium]|nr:GntR family transcriptional regulator [Candidatus Bipolaricaulota bacterium]
MEEKLYARIKDWLRLEIEAGRYRPGDRIPTEHELMERFGVSRATVRHAIQELVLEGWLYRVQGSGTFVARPKYRQTLSRLTSFSEDMQLLGLTPRARLLQFQVEEARPPVAEALGIPPGSQVLRIERLRYADDEPMAINLSILPRELLPDLNPAELEGKSLYGILEKKYGFILSRAEQTLEPALADEYTAKLLEVPVGSPLLLVEGVVYLKNGVPIEWVQIRYRGDRYKFHIVSVR